MPQLDAEAINLIAQRNAMNPYGLGLSKRAKRALSAEDRQLLSNMTTNTQGRHVLGIVATYLRKGYEFAENASLPWGAGSYRDAMKSSLDGTNRYAQKTYNAIPDNTAPLTAQNRARIEECLVEAREHLGQFPPEVEDLNRGLTGMLTDYLLSKLPPWARPNDKKTMDKILLGVGITAAVIGALIAIKLVMKIALGGQANSELREAEDEALRIAEADRRKRHSRTAFSVS